MLENAVMIAPDAFLNDMLCHPLQNCRYLLLHSNTLKQTLNAKMYWLSHTFCWPERDLNRCSGLGGQVLCWIQNSELETNLQLPWSPHFYLFHVILTRPLKSGKGRRTHQSLQHRGPYVARDQVAVASMEAKCEIRSLRQHFPSYLVSEAVPSLRISAFITMESDAKASHSKRTAMYGKFSAPFESVLFTSLL